MGTYKSRLLICIVLCSFLMSGCIAWDPVQRYSGEHTDLIAAAIYSIPGTVSDVEDQVIILEEDGYGRVMFAVCLPDGYLIQKSWNDCVLAVIITQKSDDAYVYFYGETNFIVDILNEQVQLSENEVRNHFTHEKIGSLKDRNDWGRDQIDTNRLVQVAIFLEKEQRISDSADALIEDQIGTNYRASLYRESSDGNKIYFILNILPNQGGYQWYLIYLDKDGEPIDKDGCIVRLDKGKIETLPAVLESFVRENNVYSP